MRGGTLDRTVAIQRATVTQSPSGEIREAWATLSTRPASVAPVTGEERFTSEQLIAKAQFSFTVRWAQVLADLTPLDRIIYPASALANSPADPLGNKIYDIIAVQEIGRREALRIIATVRQDELP
jgi:head-tail adaptor